MIEYILTIGIITVICLMVEILFHNHIGLYSFDVRRTNSLRGILAILIILHHLSSKIDISFLKWFHDFGAPIVSMFFFVSGYGLIKSYLKKGSTYIDGFLAKRLGKVLPIYFIGSFVMALVTIYNVDDFGGGISLIFSKLKHGIGPLPYSWFILAIIIEYFGFYIATRIFKRIKIIIISMFVFNCGFALLTIACKFASYWYISLLCVPAGMVIAYYEHNIDRLNRLSSILFFLAISLAAILCSQFVASAKLLYFFYNILAAVCLYLMVRLIGFPENRFMNYLGKISLEIYLIHGIFIYFLTPLSWSPCLILTATIGGTILAAGVCNRLLNQKSFTAAKSILKQSLRYE